MQRLAATGRELQILLNTLADDGRSLSVRAPFYEVELFKFDPATGKVTSGIDREAFEAARNRFLPPDSRSANELPGWPDVRDALLSAGIVPYANEAKAAETLHDLAKMASRASNPRPTFLAYDTNTLYARLPSRALPERLTGPAGHALRHVVSGVVDAELAAAISHKYDNQDLDAWRRSLSRQAKIDTLRGVSTRKGRKAKMARSEIDRLVGTYRGVKTAKRDLKANKEDNDDVIAEDYAAFQKDQQATVVLLTSDGNMQEQAQKARLQPVLLENPDVASIPRGEMDERVLCRFLHDLAVNFAVLHLSPLDVRVLGDWNGKTPEDKLDDAVRLDFQDAARADGFRKQQTAARAVEALLRPHL